MSNIIDEARLFSEAIQGKTSDKLLGSSVSAEDARLRMNAYQKVFSRYNENKREYQKMFSGYAETPLLSTQYFNATVAAYVSSFAGFMSIERDMDQPNGLFYWLDVLGVSDYRTVMPNLGPDMFNNINTMGRFESDITSEVPADSTAVTYLIGRKIIPGTLRIKIKVAADNSIVELIDAGQGEFMARANILKSSKIDYKNGNVQFELITATATGDKVTLIGSEDTTGVPCNLNGAAAPKNDNRFLAKLQQIGLSTVPDMLSAEYNISPLAPK